MIRHPMPARNSTKQPDANMRSDVPRSGWRMTSTTGSTVRKPPSPMRQSAGGSPCIETA